MKHGLSQLSALVTLLLGASSALAQSPSPGSGTPPGPATGGGVFTPAPVADSTQPSGTTPSEDPKPLPWRGTTFTWNQALSTSIVGVGRDYISNDYEYYGWDFSFSPNFYVLDLPDDKINVSADVGFNVELTNSDTTTTKNEPQFKDVQVAAGYTRNLYTTDDKEWATLGGVRARLIFPTSEISFAQGRILTTTLGATLNQRIRLFGNDAVGLNNITLNGGFVWSHLFSQAYNPVDGDFQRTRQNASGKAFSDDQLSFNSLDIDRLIPSIGFDLPLVKDLTLSTQFRLIGRFKHDFEGNGCDVIIGGECVEAGRLEDRNTYFTNSTFDVALSQPIYDVVTLAIGYNNETLTLGEDGKSRNFLYSPDAQFYLDVTANLDEIYSKASGRDKQTASQGTPSF